MSPSSPRSRVTQQDVARMAGVNRATVSLALQGNPRIPATTRERILNICQELGYAPDPMLSALATYRNEGRPAEFRGTLGWLAQESETYVWKEIPHFAAYLKGAQSRAEKHGYRIEVLDLGKMNLSWGQVARIARSRGIDGVLLCPQPYPNASLLEFPWADFSVVTFGYTIKEPKLNLVTAAQCRAAFVCTEQMFLRGYKRIGFCCTPDHNKRTNYNFTAGYLAAWEIYGKGKHMPICEGLDYWAWFEHHRPDAILSCTRDVWLPLLTSHGISVPDEVGLALPLLDKADGPESGVWEDNEQIGATAVDLLVSSLHHRQRGIPMRQHHMLIEGAWVEAQTLRPRLQAR